MQDAVSGQQRRNLPRPRLGGVPHTVPPFLVGCGRGGVPPASDRCLGASPVDQLARHLVEEPTGRIVLWRAPGRSGDCPRDVEPLTSPRDTDVREPPLLRELIARTLRNRTLVRKDTVLTTGKE